MYDIQHCFICRPSDSTVSEDARIEPRTVATTALAVRHSILVNVSGVNNYAGGVELCDENKDDFLHTESGRSHPVQHRRNAFHLSRTVSDTETQRVLNNL
jgi:hypothetical protein